jgi:hypothetical protein
MARMAHASAIPQPNDRTTEREIDDEDKPAIWMVTPECHGHKEHFSEELGLI